MSRPRVAISSLLVALSLSLVALAIRPASAAAPRIAEISRDQYDNLDSQHATETEPDTFAYGHNVLAAFQSGRFFDGGASNIGFAFSRDAGLTWQRGFLPSLTVNSVPAGAAFRASDPSVAYDRVHNTWLINSLVILGPGNGLSVSRSPDGVHWSDPATVVGASAADKNWIVCDNGAASPFAGNCYVAWDDALIGTIYVSTSHDGGITWSAPATTTGARGIGVQPVVRPDGTLIVVTISRSASRSDPIISFTSNDGGATFGPSVTIADFIAYHPSAGLRTPPFPSVEVDREGGLYVVWADCRFRPLCSANDIVISTSADGGGWSPITRIPIDDVDSGVDHFTPGLAVDPTRSRGNARLAVTYYYLPDANCRPDVCDLNVGAVTSHDQGHTWQREAPLVPVPMKLDWIPATNQGRMLGDYISTSFTASGAAVGVFPIAAAPDATGLHQSMFSARLEQ